MLYSTDHDCLVGGSLCLATTQLPGGHLPPSFIRADTLHLWSGSYTRKLQCTLQCTALHCTALHCTALHCIALHCSVQCTQVIVQGRVQCTRYTFTNRPVCLSVCTGGGHVPLHTAPGTEAPATIHLNKTTKNLLFLAPGCWTSV